MWMNCNIPVSHMCPADSVRFIGLQLFYNGITERTKGGMTMKIRNSSSFVTGRNNCRLTLLNPSAQVIAIANAQMDAEYAPLRKKLLHAGLDEAVLRRMDPDDRVALLEQAKLDPYDYIYLAC